MKKREARGGLVYSSEYGTMCPGCDQPVGACRCRQSRTRPPGDGIVRLQRETKGRKGRGVTLIYGLPLAGDDLKKLAKSLKQKCGSGGSLKNGVVEMQGDQRDFLAKELTALGYRVKRAGD